MMGRLNLLAFIMNFLRGRVGLENWYFEETDGEIGIA